MIVALHPALIVVVLLALGASAEPPAEPPAEPAFAAERLPAGRSGEEWTLVSETSAVIYWETENRARSCVHYGPTPDCPKQTPLSEISPISGQPGWTHFHRLRGLQADQRYYFRVVSVGTDGTTTAGGLNLLQTRRDPQAVRIPDDLPGKAYVLDRPNTTYVVTRDLGFPLGGLLIQADNVTLDLDGHELLYNQQPAERSQQWDRRAYEEHDFGVKVARPTHTRIFNGTIRQGPGNSRGTPVGVGCNPVYCGGGSAEIAGLECVWAGDDVSGLYLHDTRDDHVHHCLLEDRGAQVTDRHMAIRSISGNQWGCYDHNLVRCARQQALANGVSVTHNEIYLDSRATNSFGITGADKSGQAVEIAFNHITGVGEHPVGIGLFGAFAPGTTVHHNWVEVRCTRRGSEYGYAGSACFRTTWGADQLDVGHNTLVAHAARYGDEVAKARALWVGLPAFAPAGSSQTLRDARACFHHNRILADGPDGAPAGAICVVCLNDSPNLIFHENDVTSTWADVLLADNYGHADGFAKFVGNVFRRQGHTADFHTIRQDYPERPATAALLANRYERGTGDDDVHLLPAGHVVLLQWIEILVLDEHQQPLGGARVEIRNSAGQSVFHAATPDGPTPAMLVSRPGPVLEVASPPNDGDRGSIEPLVLAKGQLRAVLPAVEITDSGSSARSGYTLRVDKPGFQPLDEPLPMDRPQPVRAILRP